MRAVFDVVGIIKITDWINVADNITIAGQTARETGLQFTGMESLPTETICLRTPYCPNCGHA